jgi:hypothetical protein
MPTFNKLYYLFTIIGNGKKTLIGKYRRGGLPDECWYRFLREN